jgi:2-polyprenyl-3-methyl-5-hydroxy-6-metoxy-1,4-benzoquinol methylase
MNHKECLLCGSTNINHLDGYQSHYLSKCSNCKFVFCYKIPTEQELNDYYKFYNYSDNSKVSPITIKSYHKLLDEFEKYRKTNKIIDVGCGAGYFLEEAKKRGWEVYGTEYSEKAVEVCLNKGINIKKGKLDDKLFEGMEFDIVTSFEVIEHINNPNEEVAFFNKLLRKGGLFYCTTPNFNCVLRYYFKSNYSIITYPEHLAYFTKSTLKKLIKQQGFKTHKILSTGISINRISTSSSDKKDKDAENKDEILRQNIDRSWYLALLKNAVNRFLTLFSLGLSLKGYFIKE